MMADYVENLKAENATLRAEQMKELERATHYRDEWQASQSSILALRAEQTRLREALTPYLFHASSCAGWSRMPWHDGDHTRCTCGLAAALSSTPTPEHSK